jgi:hypothetical protein
MSLEVTLSVVMDMSAAFCTTHSGAVAAALDTLPAVLHVAGHFWPLQNTPCCII